MHREEHDTVEDCKLTRFYAVQKYESRSKLP